MELFLAFKMALLNFAIMAIALIFGDGITGIHEYDERKRPVKASSSDSDSNAPPLPPRSELRDQIPRVSRLDGEKTTGAELGGHERIQGEGVEQPNSAGGTLDKIAQLPNGIRVDTLERRHVAFAPTPHSSEDGSSSGGRVLGTGAGSMVGEVGKSSSGGIRRNRKRNSNRLRRRGEGVRPLSP